MKQRKTSNNNKKKKNDHYCKTNKMGMYNH